jgi:gamma-glutamyltranspeptidase/glutathione hydrolase
MQPQGHAQIVINLIDFDMNLQEAGDAPRIRHVGSSQPTGEIMIDGGYLSLESGFSINEIEKLKKLGHKFNYDLGGFGGYQAIMKSNGVLIGASDSRKDGHASGY